MVEDLDGYSCSHNWIKLQALLKERRVKLLAKQRN